MALTLAVCTSCSETAPAPRNGDPNLATGDPSTGDPSGGDASTGPGPGFARIDAGIFWMGSPEIEEGRLLDETHHHVTISHSFWLGETEVTQEDFAGLTGWNPSWFSSGGAGAECGADCPVESVSWWDAVAYTIARSESEDLAPCYTLTEITCTDATQVSAFADCMSPTRGGIAGATLSLNGVSSPYHCAGYRLPTEAEWEYAARATTTLATYNGNFNGAIVCESPHTTLDPIGWFCGNAGDSTHAVASAPGPGAANPWGLLDALGNVWEWCWDYYGTYPGDITDPEGPSTGSFRVLRGGSWHDDAVRLRSAQRASDHPYSRTSRVGFRLARTVP